MEKQNSSTMLENFILVYGNEFLMNEIEIELLLMRKPTLTEEI